MRKKFLTGIVIIGIAAALYGCNKKQMDMELTEYSMQIGAAQGSVDFKDTENPDISIKDIRSYVGKEIDYSSGVEIKNMEQFDDFQMWVDATGVDIYTIGKYTATYRFVYGGKEIEKTIGVAILSEEEAMEYEFSTPPQESTTVNHANNVTGNTNSNPDNINNITGNTNSNPDNTNHVTGNTNSNPDNTNHVTGNTNANPGNVNSTTENTTGNSSNTNSMTGNTQPQQTPSESPLENTTTAKKEIITTAQKGTSVLKTVGYTNIELLSGKYVKLKCTNAKYIVSTRTDVSQTNKNGQEYKVSKLIITYNTGVEQVLETVEEAVR